MNYMDACFKPDYNKDKSKSEAIFEGVNYRINILS